MGDVIPFIRPNSDDKGSSKKGSSKKKSTVNKKTKLSEKHKGNTLCKSGFHKWVIEKDKAFDVKFGKLVTSYRCERCDAVKNSAQ